MPNTFKTIHIHVKKKAKASEVFPTFGLSFLIKDIGLLVMTFNEV